jgi:hypothetical protein
MSSKIEHACALSRTLRLPPKFEKGDGMDAVFLQERTSILWEEYLICLYYGVRLNNGEFKKRNDGPYRTASSSSISEHGLPQS